MAINLFSQTVFFSKYTDTLSYLKLFNVPKEVVDFKVEGFTKKLKVLFGKPLIQNNGDTIYCHIDLFASSFFMLTRWEEYVNRNRDKHNRFPSKESIAYKFDFLHRPIVNEYVDLLWNMVFSLDSTLKRKQYNFSFLLTHDVDATRRYKGLYSILRESFGDILIRKNLIKGVRKIFNFFIVKLTYHKDPYNTFDYLMSISEKLGVKSHFFFMSKGITEYDNKYFIGEKSTINLLNKIIDKGHNIGLHPTYNSYNSLENILQEKNELELYSKVNINTGRGHYLRFEVPKTWQIWEDIGMKWDSTLSYADKEGFRCGVCYEYPVFNILTRKKLSLREKPLIVMEGSFVTYHPEITPEEMKTRILTLIDTVKEYNGEFVFLWHNSSFNTNIWKKYKYVYEEILFKYIGSTKNN